MDFSDFACRLMPYLKGSMNKGGYAAWLLSSIVDADGARALSSRSDSTLRSYLSGKRSIAPLACELIQHLDVDAFRLMLESKSQDVIDGVFHAFSSACPSMTAVNVCEVCAGLFADILMAAAGEPPGRHYAAACELDDESSFMSLVISEAGLCPLCGKPLTKMLPSGVREMLGRCVATLPADARADYRVEGRYHAVLLGNLAGFADCKQIALCSSCADDYERNCSQERYLRLASAWRMQRDDLLVAERIASNPLDSAIEELLRRMSLVEAIGVPDLRFTALSLKKKIHKEDGLLLAKVQSYVAMYYVRIRDIASDLEGFDGLNFCKISKQVGACFCDLDKMGIDQSEVFDRIVCWIMEKSGYRNRAACEALTSFFIQDCEVFNEIS